MIYWKQQWGKRRSYNSNSDRGHKKEVNNSYGNNYSQLLPPLCWAGRDPFSLEETPFSQIPAMRWGGVEYLLGPGDVPSWILQNLNLPAQNQEKSYNSRDDKH